MARLIDADALRHRLLCKPSRNISINSALELVSTMPTVDPIKHGHWTDRAKSILGLPTEACSECAEWSVGYKKDYCPNCGAKMDKREERLVMPKADGSTIPKDYMAK